MYRKKKRKSKVATRKEEKECLSLFNIIGLVKLSLSPVTQKAIDCVIGINLTAKDPWIYVKKEKIEDNLDLHQDSSEFLPIQKEINEYPEENILIGFNSTTIKKRKDSEEEEFLICTTTFAKENVLEFLKQEETKLRERIKNALVKEPGKWHSLKSEEDVNDSIIRNFRPLLTIEYDIELPSIYNTSVRFRLKQVEENRDGYVELVSSRKTYTNVYKTSLDAQVQVTRSTTTSEAQTILCFPRNNFTQYNFQYEKPNITVNTTNNLLKFINEKMENLQDFINDNWNINLYTDEYQTMRKKSIFIRKEFAKDIMYVREIAKIKNKKVAHLSYHPTMSGIFAVAYSSTPLNRITQYNLIRDEVNETIFDSNYVLIWCHSDKQYPLLYLRSTREVNYVSFCPSNPNLIIGALSNGQIIIWDITGKIENIEAKEFLTQKQSTHRAQLYSLMNWWKQNVNKQLIEPTAISNIQCSHSKAAVHISWLSTDYEVTKNGVSQPIENDKWNMQFITCGMDGIVNFWNLNLSDDATEHIKRRYKRLTACPSALIANVSPFKIFNKVLIPQYKIIVLDPTTKQRFPISSIAISKQKFVYNAINSQTITNVFDRTYYNISKLDEPFVLEPKFTLVSITGSILKCHWTGNDYDQGQKINTEFVQSFQYLQIHDGPIQSVQVNPRISDFILTVGGRVFAIWHSTWQTEKPIIWRKSKIRYVSGLWSKKHPSNIVIARQDSHVEIWDFISYSKAPTHIFRLSGTNFTDIFSDHEKLHTRKNTFATSDINGAIRIYNIPKSPLAFKEEIVDKSLYIIERIKIRRVFLENIKNRLKQKEIKTEEAELLDLIQIEKEEHVSKVLEAKSLELIPIENEVHVSKVLEAKSLNAPSKPRLTQMKIKFQQQNERVMLEKLFEIRKLNLPEIMSNRKLVEKINKENIKKEQKFKHVLKNKDKYFQQAVNKIYTDSKTKKKIIISSLADEDIIEIKDKFNKDYYNTEYDVLNSIQKMKFQFTFDWTNMITDAKNQKIQSEKFNYSLNIHKERHRILKEKRTSSKSIRESITLT